MIHANPVTGTKTKVSISPKSTVEHRNLIQDGPFRVKSLPDSSRGNFIY